MGIGAEQVQPVSQAIVNRLDGASRRPLVVGICGSQGSGKSTLARALVAKLGEAGLAAASLSLDDLYLTRAERERLGREVHPLLRTRGVPGTHDVALGLSVLAALDAHQPVRLPRFDKSVDDRAPEAEWERIDRPLDVLLFEGWCVGAQPQPVSMLRVSVNPLEREEDADGEWRRYVNAALRGPYRPLFARIDFLLLLAAPSWDVVRAWRIQQEDELRAQSPAGAAGIMDDAQITRFIQHYERLTRYILAEMPSRADMTILLGRDRAWEQVLRQA
jgi:D-glycerate 3-kinase